MIINPYILGGAPVAETLDSSILSDSPWGYWRLRETGTLTVAADFSGNGRGGTYTGTIAPASAIVSGNTGSVSVTGGRVKIPAITHPTSTAPLSVEIFIKTTQSATRSLVGMDASSQRRFQFRQSNSTAQLIIVLPSTVGLTSSGVAINDGAVHQIVFVWDPSLAAADGRAKIYIDGALNVSSTASWTAQDLAGLEPALFSREANAAQETWASGESSNAAIYTTALTPARVAAHWAARNSL